MPLHELRARTAEVRRSTNVVPSTNVATTTTIEPPPPRTSLKGLDLATLAAPNAPSTTTNGTPRIDDARLGNVPAIAKSMTTQQLGALRASIDGIGDLEARQRAFLRVLETFGSEWTPDATSRVLWGGGVQVVGELKKRGLWQPWETPRGQAKLALTPEQQTQFIDEVVAPSWKKLVDDTRAYAAESKTGPFDATLAQHARGLVELEKLWTFFAKTLWRTRTDAVAIDDDALARVVASARPADRIAVAGAVDEHRPEAAKKLVDGALGAASLDDIGALLLAADQPGTPLASLRALIGERLPSTHGLDEWRAYAAAPSVDDVDSVKEAMKRVHAAALAIEHGKLGDANAIRSVWLDRASRFDLDEPETAAKVVGLAESLSTSRRFGNNAIVDDTLALMPDATLVKLAMLPPLKPPPPTPKPSSHFGWSRSSSSNYVEDPQARIRREASSHVRNARPDVLTRMLAGSLAATAPQKREDLGLAHAFLYSTESYSVPALEKPSIAAAAANVVSSLLRDPSTTDEPRDRKATTPYQPSDASLQKLLMGASSLSSKLGEPLPLDVDALAPLLPSRPAEELGALLSKSWCGDSAVTAVRAELRARFAATTLEPHEQLLNAAFVDQPATEPDRASLDAWCTAQRAHGSERHAAGLVAIARAFGPDIVDGQLGRQDAVEGALLASFSDLVDDAVASTSTTKLDDKRVRELFGLAHELEKSMPHDFAPKLSTIAANKLPLDAVTAPFLDSKLGMALMMALPQAHSAAEARITSLSSTEASAFFDGARDASELTQRIGVALKGWCGVDSYQKPIAKNARDIAEHAIANALERLARIGDPNDADQRQLVLFAAHALRDKLGQDVIVDVSANAARKFVDAASAKDALALCLDAPSSSGLHEAAIVSVEARAKTGAPSALHPLLEAFGSLTSSSSSSKNAPPADIVAWRKLVDDQLGALADRPWRVLWSAVDAALDRALAHDDVATRTRNVIALMPPSREQNQALVRALGAPPIPFEAIAHINAYGVARNDDTVLRPERRLLAQSIVAHPDGPFAVIDALNAGAPALPAKLVEHWRALSDVERRAVVEDSFRRLFQSAYGDRYGNNAATDATIKKRVDDALEKTVFSTLRKDPDLAKLVDRLQPIFRGLPRNVQARVAAAFALEEKTSDPPAVLRRLLENAGVVAIKVAQQICEDPKVPKRFRDVLESLRDQNLEVDALDAWSVFGNGNAPRAAHDNGYDALGKRLGTGSVKQANRVVSTSTAKDPLVLAFLKPGVKEEIEQSLSALAVDAELAPIVGRVRSMLTRELDLDQEATAFKTMAEHLKPWSFMRVPDVVAHTRESLLRTMSPGTPVSEILRTRTLADDEKHALQESYRALFAAALDPARLVDRYVPARGVAKCGFVLTDPHQGNVALDRAKDGRVVVDLFDPGQFETVDAHEAALFVKLIVHLSQSFWAPSRDALVAEFAKLIYDDAQKSQWQTARNAAPSVDVVAKKLAHAWDDAERSLAKDEREPGAFLRAWLFKAADEGLQIPDAYFGVAKMLHTIDSQCRDLGLDDVIRDEVARLYKGQLSFKKALGIFGKKLGG